jgi:hypothetical protein
MLFTHIAFPLLERKVVSLSKALSVGAGFNSVGYCRLGKVDGMSFIDND